MLGNKLARNEAKCSKNQCWNNYRIIQMSDSRDEVWYQIEWHTQVAGSQISKQLRGTWGCVHLQHALINDQFVLEEANNLFAYAPSVKAQTNTREKTVPK